MKKKIIIAVAGVLIVAIAFSVILLRHNSKSNFLEMQLKLENGILSWQSISYAESYDVLCGGYTQNTASTSIDLSSFCKTCGEITVEVYAIEDTGKRQKIGKQNITVLPLQEPLISLKENKDGKTCYSWYVDENAGWYEYDLFDGNGFQKIEPEDKAFFVPVNTSENQRIAVRAKGSSKKSVLYTDCEATFDYESGNIFNLSRLADYPFVFTGDGNSGKYAVATTLKKGTYQLDVTLFLMDSKGGKLIGNGTWGRRITDNVADHWFCENDPEGHPEAANTIPNPSTAVTQSFDLSVNRFGEVVFDKIYNFKDGEMVVFADIRYNGVSVIAKRPIDHTDDTVYSLKLGDLNPIATYTGAGIYYSEGTPDQFEVQIPVSWADGTYRVKVGYYGSKVDGSALEGNGIFARIISDENRKENSYLCEYDIPAANIVGTELFRVNEKHTAEFSVKVRNGRFKLVCTGFRRDEIVTFTDATKISGSSKQFKNIKSYKYVFRSSGPTDYEPEQFVVGTNRTAREQLNVDVTYYVMDKDGWMLSGNGFWGRRICDESGNKYWCCATQVRADYPDSTNTIPESVTPVTRTMRVTVNKKGRFVLEAYDFLEGETVVVADVKYKGKSILL